MSSSKYGVTQYQSRNDLAGPLLSQVVDAAAHVSRPKVTGLGFGRHHGLLVRFRDGPVLVYDLGANVGIRAQSLDGFLLGRPLTIESETRVASDLAALKNRLIEEVSSPICHLYSLIGRNCEHWARGVYSGRFESEQIQLAIDLLATLLQALAEFGRAQAQRQAV